MHSSCTKTIASLVSMIVSSV